MYAAETDQPQRFDPIEPVVLREKLMRWYKDDFIAFVKRDFEAASQRIVEEVVNAPQEKKNSALMGLGPKLKRVEETYARQIRFKLCVLYASEFPFPLTQIYGKRLMKALLNQSADSKAINLAFATRGVPSAGQRFDYKPIIDNVAPEHAQFYQALYAQLEDDLVERVIGPLRQAARQRYFERA